MPVRLSISSNLSLLNAYKWAFVLVGFCPTLVCYGLLIIITPQGKEVDFTALTINMPISDLKLIIDTSHSDLN